MQVFAPRHFQVHDAHRLDVGWQVGIEQDDRIIPRTVLGLRSNHQELDPALDRLVVAGVEPGAAAYPRRVQPIEAHAVTAHIAMPARQERDLSLAERAYTLRHRADGGD